MWMNTQIVTPAATAYTYYTPWFPRGADNGVFALEMLESTVGNGWTATVVHKNREDEGSAPATAGTFASLSGNFYEVNCTGLKELLRYQIQVSSREINEGVVFRFLAPTWYSTATVP